MVLFASLETFFLFAALVGARVACFAFASFVVGVFRFADGLWMRSSAFGAFLSSFFAFEEFSSSILERCGSYAASPQMCM